jgi:probable F420-dependent oxidoreductase
MKVGVHVPQFGGGARPEVIGPFAQAAEAAGFDSLWVSDHVVLRKEQGTPYPYSTDGRLGWAPTEDVLEPLTLLTYLAGITSRVQLGTSVLVLPMRQPVLHAKILASIDHLSGGRMLLGGGLGWWKEEFAVLGMPFAQRGRRMDEYLQLLRALWRDDWVNFKGEFYECVDWTCNPKPVHGTIPIWLGGESRQQLERVGKYADGWHAGSRRAPTLRQDFAIAREAAERAGRDPQALTLSIRGAGVIGAGTMEQAAQRMAELAELGAHHVVCSVNTAETDHAAELLAEFGGRYLADIQEL